MSGTSAIPVRASADPESPWYVKLTMPMVWSVNGLRYQFPLMAWDMRAGWVSYFDPWKNTKVTLIGNVLVLTYDEWMEQKERNGRA